MRSVSIETEDTLERERIRAVYAKRDSHGRRLLYAWHLPTVRYQEAVKARMFAKALRKALGAELEGARVLDVGCGSGDFLRTLVEWGATPANLMGTEFLEDRLRVATGVSPVDIAWRLGGLDFDIQLGFDLVSAHTVFSSIPDDLTRRDLAAAMWEKTKPGGWVMVFDFRYDNPANKDVRKVTHLELDSWWPAKERIYLLDMLAPPLARRLVGSNFLVAELLTLLFPFLRSHFVFLAKK